MKKISFLLGCVLAWILCLKLSANPTAHANHTAVEYIENKGQWKAPFRYKGVTALGDIYLRKDGFRILMSDGENHDKIHGVRHGWMTGTQQLKYHAYDVSFVGSDNNVSLTGDKPQKHFYNYFLGNDQSAWRSGIHPVMAVNYTGLYKGIDAHVYSESGNIKYDLIVQPGAKVSDIRLKYQGIDGIRLDDGKLVITTSLGDLQESIPYSYQYVDGVRKEINVQYNLKGDEVSFKVSKEYNSKYPLYIDPILVFCTFTGSTADNWGFTATYDSVGNFYAGGIVLGVGYPASTGAFQITYGGGSVATGGGQACDVGISKFDQTGASLLWASYLGGTDNEYPQSLIVDNNDNLCIAGRTYSSNFPVSTGCFDATYNGGGDLFVTKMSSNGSTLIGSTYVGGSAEDAANEEALPFLAGVLKHNYGDDARSEIIFDGNNNVYIAACSKSSDFPTANPFQAALGGGQDGVIVELNDNLSTLLWSTYVGGTNNDAAYVLSINKTNPGELFVAGGTMSPNFPSTPGTLNPNYLGGTVDGFVLKFNTASKALLAGTFIGTNQYDQVYGVQTDDSNHVYIMGQSLGAYPTTTGVYSNPGSSQFISKLSNNLNALLVSTVFGSGTTASTNISPNAFLVDKCQSIYVSGWGGNLGGPFITSTIGLPLQNPLQATTDGQDFYFIVFSKNMTSLLYASYFGQVGGTSEHVDGGTSRFDQNGVIYQAICAACGASMIFPTTPGSYSPNNPSPNCNLAALKISFDLQDPDADAIAAGSTTGCTPFTVQFINNSTSATSYVWDFGDGSPTSTLPAPAHTYTTAGTYVAKLLAINPGGCTTSVDSTTLTIIVRDDSISAAFTYTKVDSCGPFSANFTNTSITTGTGSVVDYNWNFGDGTSFNGPNPPLHVFPSAGTYTVSLVMTDTTACNTPSTFTVVLDFNPTLVSAQFVMPDSICLPALVNFIDQSTNAITWNWNFGDGNTSTTSNPSNNYATVGTFNVFLVAGNVSTCNKFDTASRTITILPSPNADFTWGPNPPQPNVPNTFTNQSTGATSYFWDFGDGTSSTLKDDIHIYQKDGMYTVCLTAKNDFGCIDTVCKQVRGSVVPLADVPTGFSPNGDGINDFVYVKGYGIKTMLFRIYNRWGEKVFESTNQAIGWDGRYKGEKQEMEVYGYTLKVEFFDGTGETKSGNITLLK